MLTFAIPTEFMAVNSEESSRSGGTVRISVREQWEEWDPGKTRILDVTITSTCMSLCKN